MRQATHVAGNVAAALGHGELRPFTFKTLGLVVDLGRRRAVAKILGVKLRGSPAWFCARSYHLMAIPGVARRLRLMIDWAVHFFFRRDSAQWIPPRLPRLSLAAVRDPEAVEISIRSPATLTGVEPGPSEPTEPEFRVPVQGLPPMSGGAPRRMIDPCPQSRCKTVCTSSNQSGPSR